MYLPIKTALPLLLLFFGGSACAPSDGGQVGEENLVCAAALTEELAVNDSTPLGFTVGDILSLTEGMHQSPLTWADGSSTVLRVTMSYASRATYEDREWMSTDSADGREQPDLDAGSCLDIVNLEMSMDLVTDDGALDETLSVEVQANVVSTAGVYEPLDALMGSLTIEAFAPEGDFDSHSAALSLVIDADGVSGTIAGQAESAASSGGDDGTVSATLYPIASFGPE